MTLIPLKGRIFARPLDPEKVTPGGIVIPDSAVEKSRKATVLAVYEPYIDEQGIPRIPAVAPNDTIVFSKYAGEQFKLDGTRDLLILRESDLLGVDRAASDQGDD